jgi:hypothetical protein
LRLETELLRQIKIKPSADIRNKEAMDRVLDSINPSSVSCTAYKHVPLMEKIHLRRSIPTLEEPKPADLSCLYNEEICNDIYGQSG